MESLQTLLKHLESLTLNQVTLPGNNHNEFQLLARPTALHAEALLGVNPERAVSSGITVDSAELPSIPRIRQAIVR